MSNLTKEQEKIIIEYYVNQKRGQLFTAKQAHTTVDKVKKFLRENNYSIRNFSEATRVSNINRKKNVNDDYFLAENSNMAWLLGFIASDGYISLDRNLIQIGLSSIDKEILEKIKEELSIERKIEDYTTNRGFNVSKLTWTSQKHKETLQKYGIIPQKTFILTPPYKLNKKYWIDYIRGYFDGDGSVNLIQGKNLRWQICGAKEEFLEWIVNFLYEEYGISKVKIQKQNREGHILYCFQYSTNATKKIYNILYTPNSLFLARKKEHFDSLMK